MPLAVLATEEERRRSSQIPYGGFQNLRWISYSGGLGSDVYLVPLSSAVVCFQGIFLNDQKGEIASRVWNLQVAAVSAGA
ncbi:hypothetical protein CUMW_081330 [Citrus unshiu]|nr:hypothetical protein CUMW_081330 [Citrus unshiu]